MKCKSDRKRDSFVGLAFCKSSCYTYPLSGKKRKTLLTCGVRRRMARVGVLVCSQFFLTHLALEW